VRTSGVLFVFHQLFQSESDDVIAIFRRKLIAQRDIMRSEQNGWISELIIDIVSDVKQGNFITYPPIE
jgi:hypothetical protein